MTTVLIIEDGDEYLDNLRRFVPGPTYRQAHDAAEALAVLAALGSGVDVVYLDMRFDRIARQRLVGDHAALARELGGDAERAWRHLADHQGLFVLAALAAAGWGDLPVLIAYDFGREPTRWQNLRRLYPLLAWVGDGASADEIRALIERQSANHG